MKKDICPVPSLQITRERPSFLILFLIWRLSRPNYQYSSTGRRKSRKFPPFDGLFVVSYQRTFPFFSVRGERKRIAVGMYQSLRIVFLIATSSGLPFLGGVLWRHVMKEFFSVSDMLNIGSFNILSISSIHRKSLFKRPKVIHFSQWLVCRHHQW